MNFPENMSNKEFWDFITPQRRGYLFGYHFNLIWESDDQSEWSGQVTKDVVGGPPAPFLGVNQKEGDEDYSYVVITCIKDRDDFFGFAKLAYDLPQGVVARALAYMELRDAGIKLADIESTD